MPGAVIGLGANLGDRQKNIRDAVQAMALLKDTSVLKTSAVYETSPVGYADQPDFLNAAVLLQTDFSPRALLGACMGIEAAMGRLRNFKNGPRAIDLDLLLYEGQTSGDEELTLPHPRIRVRQFVLTPLFDLFPAGEAFGYHFELLKHNMDEIAVYAPCL
jgi:2-amino-4-hydroxy-6-hydroxymethyldihydropteridine diphosphokinase